MHEQIRVDNLFKGRLECFHQRVRQLAHEADRVNQNELMIGVKHDAPLLRVEGRKKHIFFKYCFLFFLGKRKDSVHQSRFSGVGVADKRHDRNAAFFSAGALHAPGILELCQFGLDVVHSAFDVPAVCFQFFFAGTSRADSAAEPGKRLSKSRKSWHPVRKLRQFDLQLAFL